MSTFVSFSVEVPTEKRVKRWGLSMEDLVSDQTGIYQYNIIKAMVFHLLFLNILIGIILL